MRSSEALGSARGAGAMVLLGSPVAASRLIADFPVLGTRRSRTSSERRCSLSSLGGASPGPTLARRVPGGAALSPGGRGIGRAGLVQWQGEAMSAWTLGLSLDTLASEAAFSMLAIPLLARLGPTAATYTCAGAAGMLAVGAIVAECATLRLPTEAEAAAFIYLAVVVTALGFVLWYSGVVRLGVERAGLFAGLVPVAAVLTSAFVGTASFTAPRLLRAVVLGAGVAVGIRGSRPGPGAEHEIEPSVEEPEPPCPSRGGARALRRRARVRRPRAERPIEGGG